MSLTASSKQNTLTLPTSKTSISTNPMSDLIRIYSQGSKEYNFITLFINMLH